MESFNEKNTLSWKALSHLEKIWKENKLADGEITLEECLPNTTVIKQLENTAISMKLNEYDLAIMIADVGYKNIEQRGIQFIRQVEEISKGTNLTEALGIMANGMNDKRIACSDKLIIKVWHEAQANGAKVVPHYGTLGQSITKYLSKYIKNS